MFNYLVIVICLLLAAFAVWHEYKSGKSFLLWRITATLLLIFSIACIALPINYQGVKKTGQAESVLLTEGFNKDSLENYPNDSVITADLAVKKQYPKAKFSNLSELNSSKFKNKELHVFGFGFTQEELMELDSVPIVFHPTTLPVGLTHINWTDRIKSGKDFKVQGSVNVGGLRQVKLVLKTQGIGLDSLIVSAKNNTNFSLNSLPKINGLVEYQLLALTGKDTICNETLPAIIEPVKPLKVLLLASSPGFEYKFLKQWLAEKGFVIAMRTNISKDKFSTDFVNTAALNLNNLSPELLDKFDLLIADLSALRSVNASENAVLKQQIFNKGLGLLVRADSDFKNKTWIENGFPMKKSINKHEKASPVNIAGKSTGVKNSADSQYTINYQQGTQVLANDAENRELAGLALAGTGKIVFTTIANTYTWMLAGTKSDYAEFWSSLINSVARRNGSSQLLYIDNGTPLVNNEIELKYQSASQLSNLKAGGIGLSLFQNPILPFQWQTNWWPSKTGWQTLQSNKIDVEQVYVYKKDSWKTIAQAGKIAATKKYAKSVGSRFNVTKQIQAEINIPVPKVYFYVLLLFAYTCLWLLGKVGGKVA